ncbi:hypothetical protein BO86DRAFT_393953 [Aspergillus japonicus CBS 114.51]|uniref:Uncharacterized protein n=2 Tax=Aspergillus TaxID=5052 RepID=A0A2V5I7U3_ASPV1|nr:hypothetical protein BO86DRAFT_393953 [Aspergillus japonicus CBS 114.51]PYI24600.1 hypothetical protein BO99DRAFT_427630 [Aspergillus violaceofuscus CBS 115571]RAH75822.1 hypothetical protein BO86DRAFT_393953 [Aspergillus japonicus CBS 114.51]
MSTISAKTTYRALLRELPRRSLATPTPLHASVRKMYEEPVLVAAGGAASKTTGTGDSHAAAAQQDTLAHRLQEAEQFAQYARAQRQYAALIERYNPGSWLDEEERIRLTARRVGLDLPVEGQGQTE